MVLSNDLISQFVKNTNDTKKEKKETTVTGTIVKQGDDHYVKLDGSELLTPVSTTTSIAADERVTVRIKDHKAMVVGNISAPSPSSSDLTNAVKEGISDQIAEFEIIIADKVSTKELEAEIARIDTLEADNVTVKEKLTATEAEIGTLTADYVVINEKLTAKEAEIDNLKATALTAETADIRYATIENLDATNAEFVNLRSTYGDFEILMTEKITANEAVVNDLKANALTAQQADIKYANIDFANIGEAAIRKIFADTGIIADLTVADQTVTGKLQGVTIHGDLIEGNTIVANKLLVKGENGLYYKLNTDGMKVETEQTEYNSLNGSNILAKSITATKISVQDLVAFGATIGGFKITQNALYSGVKESVENITTGIYMDNTGQLNVGDQSNYIKYFLDPSDGQWKLSISADQISLKTGSIEDTINDAISKIPSKDISVGARNLQRNADFKQDINTTDWWISQVVATPDKSYISVDTDFKRQGYNSLHCVRTNSDGSAYYLYSGAYAIPAEAGDTFTASFEYYISSNPAASIDGTYFFAGMNSYAGGNGLETINKQLLGELVYDKWTKVVVTGTLSEPTTTNIAFMIATDGNFDFYISKPKVERGNVATDFTVAPEDVDASIANVDTKVETNTSSIQLLQNEIALKVSQESIDNINSTINAMNTAIQQNANSIALKAEQSTVDTLNQSVSTNSASIQTLTDQIVLKAEQSTVDSVSQIVTNQQASIEALTNEISLAISQEELTNALQPYATSSSLELTSTQLRAEFKASGGYNLVRNSTGYGDTSQWVAWNGSTISTDYVNDTIVPCNKYFYMSNGTNTNESYVRTSRFKLKANTKYTVSGYFAKGGKCPSFDVFVLTSNSLDESDTGESYDNAYEIFMGRTEGADGWFYMTHEFTTGTSDISGFLRIDNNGYDANGSDNNTVSWCALIVNEGSERTWSPHPDEVYSGNTVIDASGVTIKNGALTITNNSGNTVIKGDSDGNLCIGGSSASGNLLIKDSSNNTVAELNQNGLVISDKSFKITSAFRLSGGDQQELIFDGNAIHFRVQNSQLSSGWADVSLSCLTNNELYLDGGISIGQGFVTGASSLVNGVLTASSGLKTANGNADISGNVNATGAVNATGNANAANFHTPAGGTGSVYTRYYRFNSGSDSYIIGRSSPGGFDFWCNDNVRFVFDGQNQAIYRVAGSTWTRIAG